MYLIAWLDDEANEWNRGIPRRLVLTSDEIADLRTRNAIEPCTCPPTARELLCRPGIYHPREAFGEIGLEIEMRRVAAGQGPDTSIPEVWGWPIGLLPDPFDRRSTP